MTTIAMLLFAASLLIPLFIIVRRLTEIAAELRAIRSLTLNARSRQGTTRMRQSGPPAPVIERAKQQGTRHPDLPKTGRQGKALKFKRVGGEYDDEGYTAGDRLQQDRGQAAEAEWEAGGEGPSTGTSS